MGCFNMGMDLDVPSKYEGTYDDSGYDYAILYADELEYDDE